MLSILSAIYIWIRSLQMSPRRSQIALAEQSLKTAATLNYVMLQVRTMWTRFFSRFPFPCRSSRIAYRCVCFMRPLPAPKRLFPVFGIDRKHMNTFSPRFFIFFLLFAVSYTTTALGCAHTLSDISAHPRTMPSATLPYYYFLLSS
jgi:hypothetical protein